MSLTLPERYVELPHVIDEAALREHAAQVQRNFERLANQWQDKAIVTKDVSAVATVDMTLPATDKLAIIEFDLETSAICELRVVPNLGVAPFNGAIYSNIHDGSVETAVPAAAAVAAAGNFRDNNGFRLACPPHTSVAGAQQMTGRATFGMRSASVARRTCIAQAAVSSTTGSANHMIELQNIASLAESNAAITALRFGVSAGTMTGRIRVVRG